MKKKKKRKNSNENIKENREKLIIALLLLLFMIIGIGYASISKSLKITGKSTIKGQTWNIYFDETSIKYNKTATVTINKAPTVITDTSGLKTEITYDVTLGQPGDYFEFTVNLVNNGNIAAKLSANPIVTTVVDLGDSAAKYFDYTVKEVTNGVEQTITKDNFSLPAATLNSGSVVKVIKVRVKYRDDFSSSDVHLDNIEFDNLTFEMNFEQA